MLVVNSCLGMRGRKYPREALLFSLNLRALRVFVVKMFSLFL
jgi:hypothetical protein